MTARLTAKKKGEWELKKVIETKNDGKRFWEMIKELQGRSKEREEETYVYTENGIKEEIMDMLKK